MAESQKHGFTFEKFVLENKLNEIHKISGWQVGYTNDWDFPPTSVKSFKYSGENPTIEFGSIERIFKNSTNHFIVLVGYEQIGPEKKVVFSDSLYIDKKAMQKLRGKLQVSIIEDLCKNIKTFKLGEHTEARKWADEQKKLLNNQTTYDIRFKIDSKKQRRIQCALNLNDIYNASSSVFHKINKLEVPDIISGERKRNIT